MRCSPQFRGITPNGRTFVLAILLSVASAPRTVIAQSRSRQDSINRAVADSIALDAVPRRIRGTVFNRAPAFPVSNAEMFLLSPNLPDGKFLHVTADRAGRFEFRDPPIGPFIIGAQCSGSKPIEAKVVAAGGFYLRRGADTAITLAANSVRRCLKSDRIFPLYSGWIESSSAINAAAPTADEARVYAATIRYLVNQKNQKTIGAVRNRTTKTCHFSSQCGRVQLPRLVQEGVVEQSTASQFRHVSDTPELLNPVFARAFGLHVMTDEEASYLAHEADPRSAPLDRLENEAGLFWVGFHKLYGRHARIVSLTRASFNSSRTQALLEVRVDSAVNGWDSRPDMFLLRKIGQDWRVVKDNLGRGELSGRWLGGKCVAASPVGHVSKQSIDALLGDFDVTVFGVAENEFSQVVRVRIGRNTIPMWEGYGSARPSHLEPIRHSSEVLNASGQVDSVATSVWSISGISQNVTRDPRIIRFDGAYENLTIKAITDSGFSGSYVGGVFGDSEFGYFCAVKATPDLPPVTPK